MWGLRWQFWLSAAHGLYGLATWSRCVQSWARGRGGSFITKLPNEAGWSHQDRHLHCFLGAPKQLTLDLAWIFIWTSFWASCPLNRRQCLEFSDYRGVRERSAPLHGVGTLWHHASMAFCPDPYSVTSWWICVCSVSAIMVAIGLCIGSRKQYPQTKRVPGGD